MKKVLLLLWVVFFSTSLVWCWNQTKNPVSDDQVFEEQHAKEMEKKAEKESEFAWESSPTLDLLIPENEIDIVTETVEYTDWVVWFLAYPQDNPQAPWIVVIHEWWGLNDHIKDMTRILAMNGYRALAVDLYKGEVASEMEDARWLMTSLDGEEATTNLLAAEEYLRNESEKVASLWWCLWWAQSLRLSLASDSLDATVLYYGRVIDDPEQLENINQPLLGIFAEDDGWIPPSAVEAFQAWLESAWKTDYDITIYPSVGHAFANPTWNNYEQEATVDAWQKTLKFLKDQLWSDSDVLWEWYFWSYTINDSVTWSQVEVTVTSDSRIITSNALPNHKTWDFPNEGNPNAISAQEWERTFPLKPTYVGNAVSAMVPWVSINGVKFQPGTNERAICENDIVYNIEAVNLEKFYEAIPLGLDFNNAHVQPRWEYHYHGIPEWVVDNNDWSEDLVHVWFAADGHMMYFSRSEQYTPSYRLSEGERAWVNCVHDRNPDVVFSATKDGSLAQDWEYDESYGDLDECNWIEIEGEYVYLVTNEYPYVSRCLMWEYIDERAWGPWEWQPQRWAQWEWNERRERPERPRR